MARAGKVRGQTPKVDAQEKKKKRTGKIFIRTWRLNLRHNWAKLYDEQKIVNNLSIQ